MVAKVYLEKAYDRIDWAFHRKILSATGFDGRIQQLIMSMVTTTSLQVNNEHGEALSTFYPSRGLHRGDPLSPYLFVLCMETLHHQISRVVHWWPWSPIRLVRGGMPLSHLFLADDLLLLGWALFSQAKVMENVIESFCKESGQLMNHSKSAI